MSPGEEQGIRFLALWRVALAAGFLASLALVVASLPASAQLEGPGVQIRTTSGETKTVRFSELGQPDVDQEYTIRDGNDESTQQVEGWSIQRVIRVADVGSYRYIQLNQPGGETAVYLSRQQVRDGFPEGPAVVYDDLGRAAFLRPSYGPRDANAGDSFTSRGTLRGVMRTGSVIDVEASARPTEADPGDEIRFRADADRWGAGQRLTYTWRFNDGNRARGERVTHSYERDGSYDAFVEVRSANTDDRGSASVTVQVGDPDEGGPDRRGGGSGGGGSDSGAFDGSGGYGGYGGGGFGGGNYGGFDDYGGGFDDYGGGFDDFGDPYRGGGGGGGGGGGRGFDYDDYEPTEPFQSDPGTVHVSGELLDPSATKPLSEGDDPDREPATARSGQLPDESGFGLPGAIVGGLLASSIFGTGVLVELEKLSPAALARRRFLPGLGGRLSGVGSALAGLGARLRELLGRLGWPG